MLLAVLEKREGMRLSTHDVFVNVAGGVRLDEPAVDMGVILAVASSFRDIPADTSSVLDRRSRTGWRDPNSKPGRTPAE